MSRTDHDQRDNGDLQEASEGDESGHLNVSLSE
jgi:hypothetical protein